MMNSDYLGGDFPGGGHSVRGPRTLGGAHLLLPHRRRQNSMVKRSTEMLDLLIWLYIDIKSFLKKIKLTSFKFLFFLILVPRLFLCKRFLIWKCLQTTRNI